MTLSIRRLDSCVEYEQTLALMEQHVQYMQYHQAPEAVWLLEHLSVYTLGSSAKTSNILKPLSAPIVQTGRGGQITYHGPGQKVVYLMLNLSQRGRDLRHYIWQLEQIIIDVLAQLNLKSFRRAERIGIWVSDPETNQEQKIAAIGVRVSKWITLHGFSINVHPDLSYYQDIIPCGLTGYGTTSLQKMGIDCSMVQIDDLLEKKIYTIFS